MPKKSPKRFVWATKSYASRTDAEREYDEISKQVSARVSLKVRYADLPDGRVQMSIGVTWREPK